MSDSPALNEQLLAAIESWDVEAREIDSEIATLVMRKEALNKRKDAAKLILSGAVDIAASAAKPQRARREPKEKIEKPPRLTISQQWQDQILAIVKQFEKGCSYSELRAALMASPLGARLAESNKSYERAMAKLGQAGLIERGWGRVFTPEAFKLYRVEVETGTVSPANLQPVRHSPMGEAILRIVGTNPGVKSRQIIIELRKDPEFDATLTPHESGAFNIIARLTKRQQIVKGDDGGCLPGIAFPHDLLGLEPKGERAPSSNAAGAPSVEGAATPSTESQPTLRLIS
jgi:hypothetical protein